GSRQPAALAAAKQAELHRGKRIGRRGTVQTFGAGPVEDTKVEGLESLAMVEMLEMSELMADGVHEARVLERTPRGGGGEPDPDPPVAVGDAVGRPPTPSLGLEPRVAETEMLGNAPRIRLEPRPEDGLLIGPERGASAPGRGRLGGDVVDSETGQEAL